MPSRTLLHYFFILAALQGGQDEKTPLQRGGLGTASLLDILSCKGFI